VLPQEDGAQLFDEIAAALGRHVVLPPGGAETIVLFVAHAHAHDAAEISPLLAIISPDMGCGKTTLLTVLTALVPSPLFISDVTPARLYRSITRAKSTLLIDEGETLLANNTSLRRLLNSGHRRASANVLRADGSYDLWCPKMLALVGDPSATLRDRSIRIYLNRKPPDDSVALVDAAARARFEELLLRSAHWAAQHFDRIAAANPAMPGSIGNRTADNWRPLLAIADAAGGRWPELARTLAVNAAADSEPDESFAICVLRDIRAIFCFQHKTDRRATSDILTALNEEPDRPWRRYNRSNITAQQLARLLRQFGIFPKTIRFGSETLKGYYLNDFPEAFARSGLTRKQANARTRRGRANQLLAAVLRGQVPCGGADRATAPRRRFARKNRTTAARLRLRRPIWPIDSALLRCYASAERLGQGPYPRTGEMSKTRRRL
jgi:hypothetical protein